MSSMLSDVMSGGTAGAARAAGFTLPAAGKTGTTDDYADAWFIGYTPHLLTGVWFGLDRAGADHARRLRRRRRGAGLGAVHARRRRRERSRDWYRMPSDVEKVAICRLSGARATDACRHVGAGRRPGGSCLRCWSHRNRWPMRSRRSRRSTKTCFRLAASLRRRVPSTASSRPQTAPSSTPMVDAALAVTPRVESRLVVERITGQDGQVRFVVRER